MVFKEHCYMHAIFLLLIEHFPDVDIRNWMGETALHRAASCGHVEIGKVLLSRGADTNALDKKQVDCGLPYTEQRLLGILNSLEC